MTRVFGYARVSTDDQDVAMQVDALHAAGVADDHLFVDHAISGSRVDRPGLDRMLASATTGDTIVVWRLDRLGRSVIHLATLAETLRGRGVALRSLTDGVDTTTTTGRLVYGLLSTLAEFERDVIRERVRAGMQAAKKRGILVGRRRSLSIAQVAHARELREAGRTLAEIGALLSVDRSTVMRALR